MTANISPIARLPDWVPSAVRLYLKHTESGVSLREIARSEGVHASTVMRQVRRFENRRDDPLVERALGRLLEQEVSGSAVVAGGGRAQTSAACARSPQGAQAKTGRPPLDEAQLDAEARRVLAALAGPGAVMAVAADMERAVVIRDSGAGPQRLAVLDRTVAEAFALRDWITCVQMGRVSRYEISASGRAALRRLGGEGGSAEAVSLRDPDEVRRTRPVTVENPVTALARRRDRDGNVFLAPELVAAAERLREDFEIAQMGPRMAQDWERFLTGPVQGGRGAHDGSGAASGGARAARDRVSAALDELGPGLADMALRCCCYLEGLETAERRLGWSARSGKIVLRIALLRLHRHYEDQGDAGKMIG
ncbi:DUF6456 domain-containing protein [Pararhodobacter oceanensis]|uniref:DUF6456 domain-containing protein n=1 Tax=Pararhodobacter oceanensis TaxID=2172121 RepID=UPI003A8D77D0